MCECAHTHTHTHTHMHLPSHTQASQGSGTEGEVLEKRKVFKEDVKELIEAV